MKLNFSLMEIQSGVIQSKAMMGLYGYQGPRHCLSYSAFFNRGLISHGPIQLLELQLSHPHSSGQEVGEKKVHAFPSRAHPRSCTYYFYLYAFGQSLVKWQSLGARTARKHCLNWLCAGHYFEGNISKEELHNVYEDNQQCLSH